METRHFGIDAHKRFIVVAAVNSNQEIVLNPIRVEMARVAEWVAANISQTDRAVVEVSTGTWVLYDLLHAHAGEVVVANPYKTRLIAEARIKTDKLDAVILARLLAARFICEVWVPDTQQREHRQLVMHRATFARQINQIKNRVHALLATQGLRCPHTRLFSPAGYSWIEAQNLSTIVRFEMNHLRQQLDLISVQRREAEQLIASLAAEDSRMARLMQITGVGSFTAFAILAAIGDIQRFPSAKNLASYAGLVPRLHQSGDSAFTGSITKSGSPILRWVMVEAAWIAVRYEPHWQQTFDRLRQRRNSSIAIVAIARKLLVVSWFLLHDHATYKHLNPQRFVRKLQEWAWKIGRNALPHPSTADFVRAHLRSLDYHDLANAIKMTPRGKLTVDPEFHLSTEKPQRESLAPA